MPIVASSGELNLSYRGSVARVGGPSAHRRPGGRYVDKWSTNAHKLGPGEDALDDGEYGIPAPLKNAFSRDSVF